MNESYEGKVIREMDGGPPLASVLIPAYNEEFFEIALRSALSQTYSELEIVVCDDSPGVAIESICRGISNSRLRYIKNPRNLGFAGNFTECLRQARGVYIKFLNDDDVLMPECVAQMVQVFEEIGDRVTLVTSRRQVIDETGAMCDDIRATTPLTTVRKFMEGRVLADNVLMRGTNFIGEPTTVMFRARDVDLQADGLFMINGHSYTCLADLALWLKLLAKGGAVYLPEALSQFRIHSGQLQQSEKVAVLSITERLAVLDDARSLGFLSVASQYSRAMQVAKGLLQTALADNSWSPESRQLLREASARVVNKFDPGPPPANATRSSR